MDNAATSGVFSQSIKHPRVLAVLPGDNITGVTYYRTTGPLKFLRLQGYPIDWMSYSAVREVARQRMGNIGSYDVFVFARAADADGKLTEMFKKFEAAGKIVVWETDDDYTNEHRQVIDADAMSPMDAATAITVSTPYLRGRCQKHTDKPVYVLPNCIDFDFWDAVPKERSIPGVTVGVVGTPTHGKDWILASDAMHRIGEEYPDVSFVVGGFKPDYLDDLPNLHFIAPVKYRSYPVMIHQIDIGLCPLDGSDPFNLSKSGIKALEYWAGGAAVIASDNPVYRRVVDADRGFLAQSPEDWYTSIKAYLESPKLRNRHATKGRQWVKNHRDMEFKSHNWWNVYSDLYWNRRD